MAQSAPLLLLVVFLNLLSPALAVSNSGGEGSPPLSDGGAGDLEGDGSYDDSGGTSGDSMNIIGGQPVTVQLGSGFIVGCVIGVVLYTTARLSKRIFQSTRAERRRNGMARGLGDDGGGRAREVQRFYDV